jgi:uncharacterized membrane protein
VKKRYILMLFLTLIIFSSFPLEASADGDLAVNRWLVESKLLENGDLYVEEYITYTFSSEFNGIYREISLEGTNGIENTQVSEIIGEKEVEYTKIKNGENGDKKVFEILGGENKKVIKIYCPSENEEKTFKFKYTLKNVAILYNDTGELYYKFLGAENSTPIDYFSVNIKLPQNINDKVKIFAHGPLNGNIDFVDEDMVHMEVENVPSNTFIESRILFPTNFIPNSHNLINKNSYAEIINAEKKLQKDIIAENAKMEHRKNTFNYISIILGGINTILLALAMISLRREVNIYEKVKSNPIPDDCTPAIASYLFSYSVNSNSIIATILDLSRKEYLQIEDGGKYKKKINNIIITKTKNEDGNLLAHERYFMNWIFDHIGTGDKVETRQIEDYAKKYYGDFWKEYGQWTTKVKEDAIDKGYFDDKGKTWGIFILILSIVFMTLAIVSLTFGSSYGLFPLFVSIFGIVYSILLFFRRSDLGYSEYKKWEDFMKYMKENRSDLDKDIFEYPLDISLIYALALGIDRKILNEYKIHAQNCYDMTNTNSWIYWYFLTSSPKNNTFDQSINRAFGTVSSSSGSSGNFGSGGGFSGGGGGGAGGGGTGGF